MTPWILALLGCGLFDDGHLRARAGAPFEFGRVRSSLFGEDPSSRPEDGYGSGLLVLSSASLDCQDLKAYGWGIDTSSDLLWEGSGLVAELTWYAGDDAGWEGVYGQGLASLGYAEEDPTARVFSTIAFDEGAAWDLWTDLGRLDLLAYGEEVEGTIRTDTVDAEFSAKPCDLGDGGDSGYAYYGYER